MTEGPRPRPADRFASRRFRPFSMQALTDFLLPLFLALGSLWFAVDLVKKLRAAAPRLEPAPAPRSSAPAARAPAAPQALAPSAPLAEPAHSLPVAPAPSLPASAPSVPAAHLAVIAATVHHLFRGRARVVGVAPAGSHAVAAVDWAREGRRDIFSSHRLR